MEDPRYTRRGETSSNLFFDETVIEVFMRENGTKTYVRRNMKGDVSDSVRDQIRAGKLRRVQTLVGDGILVYAQAESRGGPKGIERK